MVPRTLPDRNWPPFCDDVIYHQSDIMYYVVCNSFCTVDNFEGISHRGSKYNVCECVCVCVCVRARVRTHTHMCASQGGLQKSEM